MRYKNNFYFCPKLVATPLNNAHLEALRPSTEKVEGFCIFAASTLTMNFPKANMRNILAILYSVCGFGYLFYVTIFPIPPDNIRIVDTVLGFLLGTLIAGVSTYYFGSSQSSADKNDLLKTANETIASKP